MTGIETKLPELLHLLESPEPRSKANETISVLQAQLFKETVRNQTAELLLF